MRSINALFGIVALALVSSAVGQSPPLAVPPTAPKVAKPPVVAKPIMVPPFAPLAVTYVYHAKTQLGRPARTGTVSAGVNWACDPQGCKVITAWAQPAVGGCAALARQIGPIASYGRIGAMLGPAELDQCNRGIPGAVMVAKPATSQPAVMTSEPEQPQTPTSPARSEPAAATSEAQQPQTPASPATSEPTVATSEPQQAQTPMTQPTAIPASMSTIDQSTASQVTGLLISVSELAVAGGRQGTLDPAAGELTINASEINLVGGNQGPRPVDPPPMSINVPAISLVGR